MKAKKIQWKKDNLRHIVDHGLSVVFDDAAKTAFLRGRAQKDGKTRIEVGKSYVEIETVGRVSRVHFYDAIGNGFHYFSVSYFSPEEGLSFTEKSSQTREVLEHVIFGSFSYEGRESKHVLPSILRIQTGAGIDAMRAWQKANAWALLGEAGMRAKAAEKQVKDAEGQISSAALGISYGERELAQVKTWSFNDRLTRAREEAVSTCNLTENKIAQLDDAIGKIRAMLASPETLAIYLDSRFQAAHAWGSQLGENERALCDLGVSIGRINLSSDWRNSSYAPKAFFPARSARYSVQQVNPNYTVTRGENGTLKLTSGIVCTFTEADALAWLRGERPAPVTQYGTCHKIETCRADGSPLVLIGCGCHKVDVARDLGGEFVELLRPSHESRLLEGQAELVLTQETREAFLTRCEQSYVSLVNEQTRIKADALRNYVAAKARLVSEREKLPALIAEKEARLAAMRAEKAEMEEALEALKSRFPGATLEHVNDIARAAFSALMLPRL